MIASEPGRPGKATQGDLGPYLVVVFLRSRWLFERLLRYFWRISRLFLTVFRLFLTIFRLFFGRLTSFLTFIGPIFDVFKAFFVIFFRLFQNFFWPFAVFWPFLTFFGIIFDGFRPFLTFFGQFWRFLDVPSLGQDLHLELQVLFKTHYDAEVYPKISALVKLARKLVTYNKRNYMTSFVSYFSQKRFRKFCKIKENSVQKVGNISCSTFPLNLSIYYSHSTFL